MNAIDTIDALAALTALADISESSDSSLKELREYRKLTTQWILSAIASGSPASLCGGIDSIDSFQEYRGLLMLSMLSPVIDFDTLVSFGVSIDDIDYIDSSRSYPPDEVQSN